MSTRAEPHNGGEERAAGSDNVIEKRFNAVEKIRPEAPPKREASVSAPTAEKFSGMTA